MSSFGAKKCLKVINLRKSLMLEGTNRKRVVKMGEGDTARFQNKEEFPDIAGWLDHWNWVDEDTCLNEAPDDWVDRYDRKLWTRE